MFVEQNKMYRHKNCGIYTVLYIANVGCNADYPVTVVYQRYSDGKVFTRSLEKFTEASFTKIIF